MPSVHTAGTLGCAQPEFAEFAKFGGLGNLGQIDRWSAGDRFPPPASAPRGRAPARAAARGAQTPSAPPAHLWYFSVFLFSLVTGTNWSRFSDLIWLAGPLVEQQPIRPPLPIEQQPCLDLPRDRLRLMLPGYHPCGEAALPRSPLKPPRPPRLRVGLSPG